MAQAINTVYKISFPTINNESRKLHETMVVWPIVAVPIFHQIRDQRTQGVQRFPLLLSVDYHDAGKASKFLAILHSVLAVMKFDQGSGVSLKIAV